MKRIFSVVLALFCLFFSCTAPISIQTNESEPVIVIYGCLTNELKNQSIRITSSSPYFYEKENPAIRDAKVKLTSSNGREYTFVSNRNGLYISQRRFSVVPGITYRLSIEVDFNNDGIIEFYEAETTTPPVVPVDSIEVKTIDIMGFRHHLLNVSMQDPIEEENYYLFKFVINDSISNYRISDFIISNDLMYNGEYVNGANITFFEDGTDPNVIERNRDYENVFMLKPGDRIRLQILNIEEGYYTFIGDCMREKYGENPFFGGPSSNIFTNLSNGAVGYFTSYCIYEKETVVPGERH